MTSTNLGFLLMGAFFGWTFAYLKYKAENSLFKDMMIEWAKERKWNGEL